jgi:hypothetical protein
VQVAVTATAAVSLPVSVPSVVASAPLIGPAFGIAIVHADQPAGATDNVHEPGFSEDVAVDAFEQPNVWQFAVVAPVVPELEPVALL